MVRDRLEELQKRTSESGEVHRHAETRIQLEEDGLENVFKLAEQIGEEIESIFKNIEICSEYMRKIFESPFKEKDLSITIMEIFQKNGKLTHNITYKLKKFEEHVKNTNKTCTVGRIEMIQYNTLKTRFRKCLNKNSEQMEIFRNHRKNTYKAQLRAKGVTITDEEISEFKSEEQLQIFNDNILIETAEAKRLLSEAEELNEQLLKIEGLITEIRDLFVQMSVLVEGQQELIDVIEYQAQQTAEYVSKTPRVLKNAADKRRKSLKMKYTCYVIIAILLLIIVSSFIYR